MAITKFPEHRSRADSQQRRLDTLRHHAQWAEQALVGRALLLDRDLPNDFVQAMGCLDAQHCIDERARSAIGAIKQCLALGAAPTLDGVLEAMTHDGLFDAAWLSRCSAEPSCEPQMAAKALVDHWVIRRRHEVARWLNGAIANQDEAQYGEALAELLHLQGVGQPGINRVNMQNWRAEAAQPIPWLVREWLVRGTVTILAAGGGTGKSLLGIGVALSTIMGTDLFPGLPVQERSSVVCLDLEDSDRYAKMRIGAFANHYGLGLHLDESLADRFHLLSERGSFVESNQNRVWVPTAFYGEVQRYCRRVQPGLIIIDHLRRIAGGADGNDNAVMGTVIELCDRLAREMNAAVLVLAHTPKAAAERGADVANVRGASAIRDEARCVWELRREGDILTLTRTKANMASTMKDPIGFRLVQAGTSVCLEQTSVPASLMRPPSAHDLVAPLAHWVTQHPEAQLTVGGIQRRQGEGAEQLFDDLVRHWPTLKAQHLYEAARMALADRVLAEEKQQRPNRTYIMVLVPGPECGSAEDSGTPPTRPTRPTRSRPADSPKPPRQATLDMVADDPFEMFDDDDVPF